MRDPSSAFTLGNRKYARTATGQNFSFGDEEDRNLREIVRQSGTSVSNLSNVDYQPPTYGEIPQMGQRGGGPLGPPAITGSVGERDWYGTSKFGESFGPKESLASVYSRLQKRSKEAKRNGEQSLAGKIKDTIIEMGDPNP
jgi:hypothetical protein